MSVSLFTNSGEIEIPTRGGGISTELLARIAALEEKANKVDELEQELDALKQQKGTPESFGLVKTTNAQDVTDVNGGYALSATENNGTIQGSLRNLINSLDERMNVDFTYAQPEETLMQMYNKYAKNMERITILTIPWDHNGSLRKGNTVVFIARWVMIGISQFGISHFDAEKNEWLK